MIMDSHILSIDLEVVIFDFCWNHECFSFLTTNFTNPTNVCCVSHSLDLLYSWFTTNLMMRFVILTTNFTNLTNLDSNFYSSDSLDSWFIKTLCGLVY